MTQARTQAAPQLGIQDISFSTGHYAFDLKDLAESNGTDPNKYYVGIGQSVMSIPAEDEDVVTLGATAAARVLERQGTAGIRTLLFATESGIDQAKAAGVYAQRLLGLPEEIRVMELKQACYAGAGALQLALGIVARHPEEKVLVIAADVARYDLGSSGEPTQGAAAVAYLVQADPALLAVEPASGVFTHDVQDFWRPNHRSTALVDGKFSVSAYTDSLAGAWQDYQAHGGVPYEQIDWFCYHQPFTKMALKAHMSLMKLTGHRFSKEAQTELMEPTFGYNKQLGNSYTASVFLGLLALLDSDRDLTGQRIGFFSYGSGAVAEFFAGVVRPGYQQTLHRAEHQQELEGREAVSHERYRQLHPGTEVHPEGDWENPHRSRGRFRFAGVREASRIYEDTQGQETAPRV